MNSNAPGLMQMLIALIVVAAIVVPIVVFALKRRPPGSSETREAPRSPARGEGNSAIGRRQNSTCPTCGEALGGADLKFCTHCGARLDTSLGSD